MTVKDFVSLRFGVPLSVTWTWTTLVVLAWRTVGRQWKSPVLPLMVAPAGGLTRLKVRIFVGISESVAVAVKLMVWPGLTVWLVTAASTGALFTSRTMIWKLLVTLNDLALIAGGLVSMTEMVTVLVLGPWVSVGVQEMAPLEETVRPAGPDTKAKVSGLGGRSESVA